MNLNKEFKQAIIDNQYYYSAFDGKMHDINDLQVCHILSKSKRTLNSIKKAYGCSEKTADILMNMPLLNTVIGTRQDNAEYKKTDDIVYIDKRLVDILWDETDVYPSSDNIFDIKFVKSFYYLLHEINDYHYTEVDIITKKIKDIQYQFHKEIDLHI